MLDHIVSCLETAAEYEVNALRLLESENRPPNWTYTYLQCLGDASRERNRARELARVWSRESDAGTRSANDSDAKTGLNELHHITLKQLIHLAFTATSAPAGSKRMRDSVARMSQVATLLRTNQTIAQLLWWSPDLQPVPPGRPVIDFDKREAGQ